MNQHNTGRPIVKGHRYERLAEKYLTEHGYTILEKNWQAGHKEIDLIVKKDDAVVFVEVKGAAGEKFGHPSEKIDRRKRENLIAAAERYISLNNLSDCSFRFDLITFLGDRLEHYPDAFQREY